MAKITKRQYQARKQEIESKIAECEALLITFEKATEENPEKAYEEIGDKWNSTHDMIYDLQRELKFLDDEWSRRNWTHQDCVQWDMITSNID